MNNTDPLLSLLSLCPDAVAFAEQVDHIERSIQSAQLVYAARVFAGACEVYAEWQKAAKP